MGAYLDWTGLWEERTENRSFLQNREGQIALNDSLQCWLLFMSHTLCDCDYRPRHELDQ